MDWYGKVLVALIAFCAALFHQVTSHKVRMNNALNIRVFFVPDYMVQTMASLVALHQFGMHAESI